MDAKRKLTTLFTAGLVAAGALAGCGDDTRMPSKAAVDHATARQAVGENTRTASDNLQQALTFVRQTEMLGEFVANLDEAEANCGDWVVGEDGQPIDGETSEGEDPTGCGEAVTVEQNLDSGTDELIDILNTRVFVDANIEQESEYEITYLLDGATVCAEEDFEAPEDRQTCISDVDALQIRLVVSSWAQGDLEVEVEVGPSRHNPVRFGVYDNQLQATVDLAAVHSTAQFASQTTGEDLGEFPTSMSGVISAKLEYFHQTTMATISVLDDVNVTGDDYAISAGEASPAAQLTVDRAAQTISGLLDLEAIDIQGPVTETETTWDTQTGAETTTETSYIVDLHLGGASGEATYAVGQERIDVQNVGLGTTTSTLDIDGKRVATLDLNKNHNRHFNFSFVNTADGTELVLDPAFDLELMLAFAQVQDKLDDVEEWMHDELMRITFDGATNPTLLLDESGAEVLDGRLTLSSTAADVTLEATAGQCVLGPEGDAPVTVDGSGSTQDGEEMPPMEDSNPHPFEELRVEACE